MLQCLGIFPLDLRKRHGFDLPLEDGERVLALQNPPEIGQFPMDVIDHLADALLALKGADRSTIKDTAFAELMALFNTAIEILDRFQNYALGKALQAREPFIGTTRVKVENLVQGYKDRILDNRIAAPAKKP